ncbi:MAG: hypothetical protein IJF50_08315, partial [Peptococcaceae bacterium]|nr:hypothetical protein [Peptococcaceae bacterium]
MEYKTDITTYMTQISTLTETRLRELLPAQDSYPEVIHEAMAYSIFAGGNGFVRCCVWRHVRRFAEMV